MPNRLIDETSPYLLQHANNPVDWYPWGPEALEQAKAEDKPILLSVGYSACHWCHVMERESFEDAAIASFMNQEFIPIKVDREERPDIDSIYMMAVQAMTGQGGWPMTVFLTPDGVPFFGGTYYPPEDRQGMPGFPKVLQAISKVYRESRGEVEKLSEQLMQRMEAISSTGHGSEQLTDETLNQAYLGLVDQFDDRHGGTGLQPKFPQPMIYEFLLRYHLDAKYPQALQMVTLTLDKMAKGGIYDQLGGGFHRYSTDREWLVPHFEKMLYDNALLSRLYLHAYQVTGKSLYKRIVEETLDYILREMTSPEGAFYSAQDADSEGVEGKFFVWKSDEIIRLLGDEEGNIFNRYNGVTEGGNFEGNNILYIADDASAVANEFGLSEDELGGVIRRSKAKLLEARETRIKPDRDEKVLTAWNGLMLASLAEAAAVLGRSDYAERANQNAYFMLSKLQKDGRLLRTYRDGKAKLNGYLEDYAFLIDGLLALHELTFDASLLEEAINLGRTMVDLFWGEASGRFYDTGHDHEELIVRPRDASDNAIPSGSSMATSVLLRLAVITGDPAMQQWASTALQSASELMSHLPSGAGHWLCALDFSLSAVKEVAIVGNRDDEATQALVSEVYRSYLPNRVFLGRTGDGTPLPGVPLLEGRELVNGRPAAYVCQNYVCNLPVTKPEELAKQLTD